MQDLMKPRKDEIILNTFKTKRKFKELTKYMPSPGKKIVNWISFGNVADFRINK